MYTEIELPKEHGLRKVARLVNLEINEQRRKIIVYFRELLLSETGEVIKEGEIKSYTVEDKKKETRMIPTPTEIPDPNNPDKTIVVNKEVETVVQEEDLAFKAWEDQIGTIIKSAITEKLKGIYNIA